MFFSSCLSSELFLSERRRIDAITVCPPKALGSIVEQEVGNLNRMNYQMNTKNRIASLSLLVGSLAVLISPSAFGEDAKVTPESVYTKYHQTLLNAKTVDEVTPFMCAGRVKEVNTTPKEEKAMFFGFIKETCPKDVHIVSSKIDGNTANLKLIVGDGKPVVLDRPLLGKVKEETKGECLMVLENGVWKVDKESWKSSSVSVDSDAPPADVPKSN
jgi:hypothetical protein